MINSNSLSEKLAAVLDGMDDTADMPNLSFRTIAERAGLDPACDLVGEDLSGQDFRSQDLRGFNFANASLAGCDFSDAIVDGVDFTGADLCNAIGLPPTAIGLSPSDQEMFRRQSIRRLGSLSPYHPGRKSALAAGIARAGGNLNS